MVSLWAQPGENILKAEYKTCTFQTVKSLNSMDCGKTALAEMDADAGTVAASTGGLKSALASWKKKAKAAAKADAANDPGDDESSGENDPWRVVEVPWTKEYTLLTDEQKKHAFGLKREGSVFYCTVHADGTKTLRTRLQVEGLADGDFAIT